MVLELATVLYPDRAAPWLALPRQDLLRRDPGTGNVLAAYSAAAVASGLIGEDGLWQELTPGVPLTIWLSGVGTYTVTETRDLTHPYGYDILPRVGHDPRFTTTVSDTTYHLRTGTRLGWDQPAPIRISDMPAEPTKGVGHAHDPQKVYRQRMALAWVRAWGDVLARVFPTAPVVCEGVIVGPGLSGSGFGGLGGPQFLVQECFNVGRQYWLSWHELHALGVPILGERVLPTDPAALIAAMPTLASLRFPVHDLTPPGVVLRPRAGRGTPRFALYQTDILPD